MSDETEQSDEVAQLREEVARLQREVNHILRVIGQEDDPPDFPRSKYLSLEAELISVRNSPHKVPILLKAHEDYACIYLNDKTGRTRGLFQVNDEGNARFEIWNKDRQVVVSIGETAAGAGEIFVASPDGVPRAGMKVNELGGIVSAQSSKGSVNALMLASDNGGSFVVGNAEGRPVAEIMTANGQGVVRIKEPTGRQMAYMTCGGDRGVVSVFNETGDQAAALSSDDNGGALIFWDSDGKQRTSLP
jgi:hypothetical protein